MTLLDDIGGDDVLVTLVNRFYDLVETLKSVRICAVFTGAGMGLPMRGSSRLILCLVFWAGGSITASGIGIWM